MLFNQGETWAWDGASWTLLATTGPAMRWEQALAYDVMRQRVVLFGGTDSVSVFGDTWEWDGLSWTQVASTGPVPRHGHAATFVPLSSKVGLFGGLDENGVLLGDIWDWDGSVWTERTATGPSARAYHAMARSNNGSSRVYITGGNDGEWALGETWSTVSSSWRLESPASLNARDQSCMVHDTLRNRIVLFGGRDFNVDGLLGDTWEEQVSVWRQTSQTGPSPRRLMAMSYDIARDRTVLFGGITATGANGETWEYAPVGAPNAPSGVTGVELRRGLVSVDWEPNLSTGVTCAIERERWEGVGWGATGAAGLVGPGITRLLDAPGQGTFRYRVQASNCAGNSAWSSDVIVRPAAPGNPRSSVVGRRRATFSWADLSDFEQAFEIEREKAPSSAGPWSGATLVAALQADTTTFSEVPGVGYWRYRVRASNTGGSSPWTSWLVVQLR